MDTLQHAKIYTAVFFFAILTAFCRPADGQILGSADLSVERRAHTATKLADGRILIVGGENASGPVSQAEIFDPNSQSFSAAGNSAPRTDHAAVLLADGRVLITGGRDVAGVLDSTEIFNPSTNSFAPGPPMQRARSGHTAITLADGKILLVGGDAAGSAEIYDPDALDFSLIGAKLEKPRTLHGAVLLKDGRVLIAGGVDSGNSDTVLDSAELFDPQSATFFPANGPMQRARGLPMLRVLPDGKVQVIGGDAEWSMEMFDPETGSFNSMAHLPPTSDLLSATLSTASRAALITTTIADNPAVQAALADPELLKLLERADHSLTEIPQSNEALVAGGINSAGEFLASSMLISSSRATVTTDRFDYAPGQTVTITGTGWRPGETVSMVLHEEPETHPDTTISSVADKNGNITNTDFAPAPSDVGRTFTLTAIGQTSGRTAQTAFSDHNVTMTITTTTGNGVACGGATPCHNPIHIAGTGYLQFFGPEPKSSWSIQIDWGDGTVETANANIVGVINNGGTCVPSTGEHCSDLSATWSSSPDHTYTTGGSKTILVTFFSLDFCPSHPGSCTPASTTITVIRDTTTTVSCASPVKVGQGSTCTATVTANGGAAAPTGTVTLSTDASGAFTGNPCTLGSPVGNSSSCAATYTPASAAATTHHIGAHYNGSATDDPSTATAFNLTVNERATTTSVSCTSPVTVGQGTTCTVTVTDNAGAGGSAPTGTVTLTTDGSGSFTSPGATCTLGSPVSNSSSCTATYTAPSASTHHIGAGYNEASSNVHAASTATAFNLTVNKRATTTTVVFSVSPIIETDGTTATVTVTDTDSNGTKTNPGVGTVVSVTSDSGDTITGTCTLAALNSNQATCQVTVSPTHASIHTITATFAATTVHAGSAGNGQLEVTPHTIVIQNLTFTPAGSTTSPRINVSHQILDIRGDQTRDHVITSAQNIPRDCNLSASAPFSTQYDRSVVGLSNVSFKAWEVGSAAWKAAKKKKCTSVELKIISFSVQAFHKIGAVEFPSNVLDLTQAPFTGTFSVCFKTSDGSALPSCPLLPAVKSLAKTPSVNARLTAPNRN